MMIAARTMGLATLLAGCAPAASSVEPPGDPTDAFYARDKAAAAAMPATHWHDRLPPRRFPTSLRPWSVRAFLPTPYLFRVTRHYQPWAARIYDVATLVLRADDAAPIRVDSIAALVALRGDTGAVRLELGGWTHSFAPETESSARIFGRGTARIAGHVAVIESNRGFTLFHPAPHGQADGQPVMIRCGPRDCSTDIALVRDWTGARAVSPPRPGAQEGIRLGIAFHRARLDDWPLIRRHALCLAARSLARFDLARAFPSESTPCARVDAAIAAAMRGHRAPLGPGAPRG